MKKSLFLVLAALVAVSGLYAQKQGEISVGGRAGMLFGLHEVPSYMLTSGYTNTTKSLNNLNFAVYAAYTIVDKFSVQAELNYMHKQGYELSSRRLLYGMSISSKDELTYSSLDFPILAKYSFIDTPLLLGALAGPYLSIPMGKAKIKASYTSTGYGYSSSESYNLEAKIDGIGFGLVSGLYVGYPVGPGRIVGDLRFILDLKTTKIKESGVTHDIIKRRGIIFALGYEVSF